MQLVNDRVQRVQIRALLVEVTELDVLIKAHHALVREDAENLL